MLLKVGTLSLDSVKRFIREMKQMEESQRESKHENELNVLLALKGVINQGMRAASRG